MAREIDNFLIRNFCNDFDQKRSGPKIRLQTHFKGIRDLFGKNPECSSWPTTTENNEISIRETLYSLDEVWSECQLIKSKINLVPPFDPIKNKLSKIKSDIEKFKESIQSSNGTQPNNLVVSENEVHRQSSRSVNASKPSTVHGFDDDVISLEKQVLVRQGSEDRFKAIGITGIAGIGKTALCQSLFISKQVKDYFLPRIWVCLSKQPGDGTNQKVAILKRMLVSLGVEKEITEGNELKGLLYALHLQLQGKRYLIVFDDARETDEWYGKLNSSSTRDGKWDALAHGLPKGCGGAVIVTSRNEELAKTMVGREGILHRVLPLSNPDFCWSIFLEAAGLDKKKFITAPSDVEIQKREIFKRCAGLPLTAKMLGQIIGEAAPNPEGAAPNETESHQAEEAAPNPVGAAPNEIESHQAEEAAPNPVGAAPNEIESHQEVLPVPAEGADPNPEGAAEEAAPIDHVTEEEDDASNGSEP